MFRVEKKLLDPGFTEINSLEILDSKNAYESFYSSLRKNKVHVPFLRKPNDEKNNRWVFPFPQDIWDFWVNKLQDVFIDNSSRDYIEIPTDKASGGFPTAPFKVKKGRPSYVYPSKYRRLWDFIYNPEFFLNPQLKTKRRMPFPRYMLNGSYSSEGVLPSLVPPFLPDAVYTDHPSFPYSHWQYTIPTSIDNFDDLLDPSLVLSQKIAFVKAYGEASKESPEKFTFSPLNITQSEEDRILYSSPTPSIPTFDSKASGVPFANEILRLEKTGLEIFGNYNRVFFYQPQRPDFSKTVIYPTATTYSPMPYAPIVIHNANAYDSSGWYYFFRQKVARSPSFPFTEDEATFLQLIEGRSVFRRLQKRPGSTMISNKSIAENAAMRVLNKDASVYYGYPTYEPDRVFHYSTPHPSEMTPEREFAYQKITALKKLILLAVSTRLYEPVVDQYGDPVYEETPYKVVTVHVYTSDTIVYPKRIVSFDFNKIQSLTVPSFLNISQPGYPDFLRNNRDIEWVPQGITASLVKLNFPHGTNHHVNLKFSIPGEYLVTCRIRRSAEIDGYGGIPSAITYVFTFLNYELILDKIYQDPMHPNPVSHTIAAVNIPFGDEASVVPLRFRLNRDHWYTHKFASPSLMEIVDSQQDNTTLVTEYLSEIADEVRSTATTRKKMKHVLLSVFTEEYNILSSSYHIYQTDPVRPFVFLRHSNNPYRAYLVVSIYKTATIPVPFFGSMVRFRAYIPPKECTSSNFYVTWCTSKGEYLMTKQGDDYVVEDTGPFLELIVKHPRQLTTYIANVHIINDTCTHINDKSLLYRLFYNTVLQVVSVPTAHLTFGPFELNRKGVPFCDLSFKLKYGLRMRISSKDYPRPFFEAMCRVYARLYNIDLLNFTLLYPYVADYCENMDAFVRVGNKDKPLLILDDVPSSVRALVPERIHPPYVFVSGSSSVLIESTEMLYYILFDPSSGQWINITAVSQENETITDPMLVMTLGKPYEFILETIKKYYFFVPIRENQFMHESKAANLTTVSLSSSFFSLPPKVGPSFVPNIASFLIQVRKTMNQSRHDLALLSQERIYKIPVIYSRFLDETAQTTRDSFHEADISLLTSKNYKNEKSLDAFFTLVGGFFREIRLSLKDPIFAQKIVNDLDAQKIQSRINLYIYEKRKEMTPLEHHQKAYDLATLYTDLQRIGDADFGFLFLKNKYFSDYMLLNPDIASYDTFVTVYESLSRLDIPLVNAFFESKDVESLSMNIFRHYLETRSINNVAPQYTNLGEIPRNLLYFGFDFKTVTESDIVKKYMFVTREHTVQKNYLVLSTKRWLGRNRRDRSYIYSEYLFENRLPTFELQEAFKFYYLILFDSFIQTGELSIFEILIILFIRIVKYYPPDKHPLPYVWNALMSYRDFVSSVNVDKKPLEVLDFQFNVHRSKFIPLLPFVPSGRRIDARSKISQQLIEDYKKTGQSKEAVSIFALTLAFYMFSGSNITNTDILPFDVFKKIIWQLRPQPDIIQNNNDNASRYLYYFHPLMDQTIIADNFRYILTFFKFI